jgi:hypothetical protein
MSKPRQTSYLYKCGRCGRTRPRGSNAKFCNLPLLNAKPCRGILRRIKTVKRPINHGLKIVG